MYDPHLRVTITGPTWRMQNPMRTAGNDPESLVRTHLNDHDRASARATAIGLAAAAILTGLLTVATGAIAPAALTGGLAGIAVGYLWNVRATQRHQRLVQQDAALTIALGPRVWTRGHLAVDDVAHETDVALQAATSITQSQVFAQGTLGDRDLVASDLREALWEVLQAADAADRRAKLHGITTAQIDAGKAGDVSPQLMSAAEQTLAEDLHRLRDHNATLGALAAHVADLDTCIATPIIEQGLIDIATPAIQTTDASALERLAAQVMAAQTILDSSTPPPSAPDSDSTSS